MASRRSGKPDGATLSSNESNIFSRESREYLSRFIISFVHDNERLYLAGIPGNVRGNTARARADCRPAGKCGTRMPETAVAINLVCFLWQSQIPANLRVSSFVAIVRSSGYHSTIKSRCRGRPAVAAFSESRFNDLFLLILFTPPPPPS